MNHRRDEQDRLARWTSGVLRQVPGAPAPSGFAAQVMAEIRRRATLPWYQRPWLQWPAPHRWLSLVAFVSLLVTIFGIGLPFARESALETQYGQYATIAWDNAGALNSISAALGRTFRLLLGQISSTHIALAVGGILATWLSTLGLGAACWRIASQPR